MERYDIAVIGAGVTGLMLARELSRAGARVALVEASDGVIAGATRRNEGWVHAGTYHALSIEDLRQAEEVVSRCQYGWNRFTRDFAPAIVPSRSPAVAVVASSTAEFATDRWQRFGVSHRELGQTEAVNLRREINVDPDELMFQVADKSINTRVLAQMLLTSFRQAGGELLLSSPLTAKRDDRLTIGDVSIIARRTILTAGYDLGDLCRTLDLPAPKVRYWQAHLAITPVLASRSVFWSVPDEPASANHGSWTITGGTGEVEDAYRVPAPASEPRPEGVAALKAHIARRFRNFDEGKCSFVSCTKIDTYEKAHDARSLNIFTSKLSDDVMSVLPGKMTEAPFVTDLVASEILAGTEFSGVTPRPLDRLSGILR